MRRRLQVLALCVTALLAVHMMAQDNGGGAAGGMGGGDASGESGGGDTGGASSTDNSGVSGGSGGGTTNGGSSTNGGTTNGNNGTGTGEGSLPAGGSGGQSGSGTGANPFGGGGLFGPETGTEGMGTEGAGEGGSSIFPAASPSPSPGTEGAVPGATPTPAPTASPTPFSGGTQGATQNAPVTFNLPGGYGGVAPQSFTLGEGRLAKPPLTYSVSISQGYDDNVYSADSHIVQGPTPIPAPTPPLLERIVGFRINPPRPPTPVLETFRPKVSGTTPVQGTQLGVVGSPVSTASLAVQIQKGSPRTVLTLDASLGLQDYWNEQGGGTNFTASFDTSFLHRLTPRATVSIGASASYQQSPNFALQNAPTANTNGGSYLNGDTKIDLSYTWSSRISTVTSYNLNLNLLAANAQNLYDSTYGTQFRYTVSARNTATVELRQEQITYPSVSALNATSVYYLLGLDSFISSKLRNTLSAGIEAQSGATTGDRSLPYFESATTLALPRGAGLTWTNRYGSEASQTVGQTSSSYRTTLSYFRPLSTKLSASVSLTYNYLDATGSGDVAGYTQQQFQVSMALQYTLTPRFSLSLSYNYFDLLSSQINSSYTRDQIYLGGNYTFR